MQLSAQVTGTSDTRVTWSATKGSISAAGLFTAPAVTAAEVVSVRAQSVADSSVSATAQVTINALAGSGPPTFLESNGQVTVEAEDGVIVNRTQTWTPQTSAAGFSGSAYVTALPNSGLNQDANYATTAPEVQFRVKFNTTGTYYVWIRGYTPTPADDSINVGIDGTAPDSASRLSMFPNTTPAWAWSNQKMDNVGRVTLNVTTAGVHVVNVWMREDGFSFDKIVLATASSFTPTGLGPAESPTDSGLPVLNLSTSNLSFSAATGGSPASQTVTVSNLGAGSLAWTAQSNQPWLAVSPASGTDSAALTLAVNASGLAAGNYTGTVTVAAAGATGSPKTINVTLSVTAVVAPVLAASPLALNFSATSGAANPAGQAVNISNGNGGSLNWTAAKGQSWLTLSAASGAAPGSLSVGVNISGMTAGTYTDNITLASAGASGSPLTVRVTLVVAAGGGTIPPSGPPPTGGSQWYIAPNGSSGGDGSQARPWDIATGLNGPSAVKPGDTIWLRGGNYGNGTTIYNSRLKGTAAAPVLVRQYPGEARHRQRRHRHLLALYLVLGV